MLNWSRAEFCRNGSVEDAFIHRKEEHPYIEIVRILRDSAAGILHLHKESVIHRDIAARNFLLGNMYQVYVTDFGLSRIKTDAYAHTRSSLGPVKYMAPESIAKKRYSEASDAYSFGVYVWEVLHRQLPYANLDTFEIAMGVVNGSLDLAADESVVMPEVREHGVLFELMTACRRRDAAERPLFAEIGRTLRNHFRALDKPKGTTKSK